MTMTGSAPDLMGSVFCFGVDRRDLEGREPWPTIWEV